MEKNKDDDAGNNRDINNDAGENEQKRAYELVDAISLEFTKVLKKKNPPWKQDELIEKVQAFHAALRQGVDDSPGLVGMMEAILNDKSIRLAFFLGTSIGGVAALTLAQDVVSRER